MTKAAKPKTKVAPKAKTKQAAKAVVKKVAPKVKPKVAAKAAKPIKKVAKAAAPKSTAKKAAPVKKTVATKKVAAPKKVVAVQKSKAVKTKAPVVKAKAPEVKKAAPVAKVVKKIEPVIKPVVIKKAKKVAEPVVVKKEIKQTVKPYFANRDFTKVAKPQVKVLSSTDNRNRYSDEELQEFKELISGKLEIARGELKYLQEQISRSSEMGDDSDARFKGLEDGTSTSEREYLSQMASRQIQYIGHLEKAMIRIENKTYGICRETGKLISKERLRAVPHATLSIEAKQGKG
ncbi:MAG: TraR/DksA C4-type zinc finger protein [Chitinophagales bacterium]|nr:TraR/DksA C4-type zinc finger protein [Chitinophagales bacterium]MBP9795459.1 TraR/DksA C4-type zinc finger protein [Chitinophagales bacterium]